MYSPSCLPERRASETPGRALFPSMRHPVTLCVLARRMSAHWTDVTPWPRHTMCPPDPVGPLHTPHASIARRLPGSCVDATQTDVRLCMGDFYPSGSREKRASLIAGGGRPLTRLRIRRPRKSLLQVAPSSGAAAHGPSAFFVRQSCCSTDIVRK
ncbi:hypothetical protein C8Q76DRAFT_134266 [Earliella scabrosa]|nr:hypothetical protein C8Q76DRAFT_134266 [Earliella scabrosa]